MGLARGARLVRDVARGAEVTRADVEIALNRAAASGCYAEPCEEPASRVARSTHLSYARGTA